MKLVLTREIAYSAGRDAGNRSMRRAGRTAWNEDDYSIAATETNRLLDIIEKAENEKGEREMKAQHTPGPWTISEHYEKYTIGKRTVGNDKGVL